MTKLEHIMLAFYKNCDSAGDRINIADVLRELVKQYAYNHFQLDGDHGINVINVKDVERLIEELEK
jgi:hypothetical protein